jgi:hypothetical protein
MPLVLEPSWLGRRVTVRRVLEREPGGRLIFGDVVGDLVSLDGQNAVVDTRHGAVEIPVALVTAAKLAPPSSGEELALEEIVAQGWRAEHTAQLGGWLLRAAGGFTGRANSVLPLRAPRMPLEDALAAARAWYAEQRLPLKFQVPAESRRLLDAELAERGWTASPDVHVMTARLDLLPRPVDGPPVELDATLSDEWLALYRGGRAVTSAARGLLTRHDDVVFASLRDSGGGMVAIGRGTTDANWLGVTAVEVAPAR